MSKYTVYLQNGNIVTIEAGDYFVHEDFFYFMRQDQSIAKAKVDPLAQFRYEHVSGIVRNETVTS